MAKSKTGRKTDVLPKNIQQLVDARKVSYRGFGMSDLNHKRNKVDGKEYVITNKKFDELGGIKKIRFSAPARRG